MDPGELWKMISNSLRRVSQKKLKDRTYRGGHQYSIWIVVKLYLLSLLRRDSPRILYGRILGTKGFRRHYGLPNRLISLSQYKKRLKTPLFAKALREVLEYSAARALRQLGESENSVLMADLTTLRSDPRKDPKAAWGFDSKGLLYGYKLGLIISKGGVVLGMTFMTGNWTEFRAQGSLLRQARNTIRRAHRRVQVKEFLADAGFDGEQTYRNSKNWLGAVALIPPRRKINPKGKSVQAILAHAKRKTPHRWAAQLRWNEPLSRSIYRQRNEIERVNGQLKNSQFRIDDIPRRGKGVPCMSRLILGKLLLYNFSLNVNALMGRKLRVIRYLAA